MRKRELIIKDILKNSKDIDKAKEYLIELTDSIFNQTNKSFQEVR
jgi:hypothetical protein